MTRIEGITIVSHNFQSRMSSHVLSCRIADLLFGPFGCSFFRWLGCLLYGTKGDLAKCHIRACACSCTRVKHMCTSFVSLVQTWDKPIFSAPDHVCMKSPSIWTEIFEKIPMVGNMVCFWFYHICILAACRPPLGGGGAAGWICSEPYRFLWIHRS